jgi:hypothetical protein
MRNQENREWKPNLSNYKTIAELLIDSVKDIIKYYREVFIILYNRKYEIIRIMKGKNYEFT